jgi:hypothetical protein
MRRSKKTLDRAENITRAWGNLRPAKQFSGLTLDKFKETAQRSIDIRVAMAELESRLRALAAQRVSADAVTDEMSLSIVHAVKGDREEGEDGELYEAMGFTRKSLRRRAGGRATREALAPKPPHGEVPS